MTTFIEPSWLPSGHASNEGGDCRRGRGLPLLWRIAEYWNKRNIFIMNIDEPSCFACEWKVPEALVPGWQDARLSQRWNLSSGLLERSHLVDRCDGGLDAVQNLIPLCVTCNRWRMPAFRCGTGQWAIAWIQGGGCWQQLPLQLQQPTVHFTAGRLSWDAYVRQCAESTGLSVADAAACAEAIDFTGRGVIGF